MNPFKKIYLILNKKQKISLISLLVLILLGALIEMISIGLLFPFIYLITEPDSLNNNPLTSYLYFYIKDLSSINLLIIGLSFIIFVYLFKSIFISILQFLHLKITTNINIQLTNTLFRNYLYQ